MIEKFTLLVVPLILMNGELTQKQQITLELLRRNVEVHRNYALNNFEEQSYIFYS